MSDQDWRNVLSSDHEILKDPNFETAGLSIEDADDSLANIDQGETAVWSTSPSALPLGESLDDASSSDSEEVVQDSVDLGSLEGELADDQAEAEAVHVGSIDDVPENPASVTPENLTPEEYLEIVENILAELVESHKKISMESEEVEQKCEQVITLSDAMRSWIDERKNSYAWKLVGTIQGEINRAKSDEEIVAQWASRQIDLGAQTPEQARRRFKRKAVTGAVVCGILFAIVGLVTNFAATTFGIVLIAGLTLLKMAVVAISAYIAHFIGSTMGYFRSWQKFNFAVERELGRARYLSDLALHSRQEVQRLTALTTQLPEYLEIVASAVQQPWNVPDALLSFHGDQLDTQYIPASLEFAVPSEKRSGALNDLERRGLMKLISPGWRARAFDSLVGAIGEKIGNSGFTVEAIDADTGNDGPRGIFRQHFGSEEIREEVGHHMARNLARDIQTDVLPLVKPPVEAIRPDVLEGLDVSTEILPDSNLGVIGWDEFLQPIIASGCDWTPLLASSRGAHTIGQMATSTSLFVPESLSQQARVALSLADVIDESVMHKDNVFVLDPPGVRPIDLAIRVDQSGILSTDDVRTFLASQNDISTQGEVPTPTLSFFTGAE